MRAAALVLMMMVRCRALVPQGGDALARRVTRPAGSPYASRLQPQWQRRQRELHAAAEEVDAEQTAGLATALERIRNEVAAAAVASGRDAAAVELVAVSKTKPIELLQAAYDAGQRVFGENYAQELINKAPQMPADVRWHFIGPLQSNKVKGLLAGVPNLAAIETVATPKLARRLDRLALELRPADGPPLDVYIQVDTSGEASKSGVAHDDPAECDTLCELVASDECSALRLAGLMTIGAPGDMAAFDRLVACRTRVAAMLAAKTGTADPIPLRLSMGMSGDFAAAIERGSDAVRVGSSIFGARDYISKA